MFNLFKSVYVATEMTYETNHDQIILTDALANTHQIKGNGQRRVAKDLETYLKSNYRGDVWAFLNDLYSKDSVKNTYIYVTANDMVKLLTAWFRLYLPKATEAAKSQYLKLCLRDFQLTYCTFQTIKSPKAEAWLEALAMAMNEKDNLSFASEYPNSDDFDVLRVVCQENIPVEFLLLNKFLGGGLDEALLNTRLDNMLSTMFSRNIWNETRSKFIQGLPFINRVFPEYDYDPCDKNSLRNLMQNKWFFRLYNLEVADRKWLIDEAERLELCEVISKIARHDMNGKTNLGYRFFLENGFNYDGVIASIKNAKANIVFHERDFFWNEINHALIGVFVDLVKNEPTDEFKDFLEAVKNV